MSKEKNKKNKKKNGGKIVLLLIIIIIAVAAILIFGKGGLGLGGSGEGVPAGGTMPVMSDTPETLPDTLPNTAPESEQTTASGEDEEGQQGSRVIIEVAEDKIFADGSVCVDTAVLRDYLLGAAGEDTEFILRDNHAVKSVYDEAKGVLDELGYEYTGDIVE